MPTPDKKRQVMTYTNAKKIRCESLNKTFYFLTMHLKKFVNATDKTNVTYYNSRTCDNVIIYIQHTSVNTL